MNDFIDSAAPVAKAALFLQRIKKFTASHHILLESNSLLSALMLPQVNKQQYHFYLILMKEIIQVYERDILPGLSVVLAGYHPGKSAPLITEDVEIVGYSVVHKKLIKDYELNTEKMNIAFGLGFMYVIEGSKLGGKVIFKHIHRHLRFSEGSGAKFISGYQADTIGLWKEFLKKFSEYVVENEGEEQAIEGAKYAFSSIYNFFEENRLVYEV